MKYLLGALILWSSLAHAAEEVCVPMKAGKYKGQCIDTSGKKAVRILDQSATTVTIENFRKDGVFYKAIIPLDQIASLSYVVVDLNAKPVNFLSLVNISHTEMRFKMKPGTFVELHPLDGVGAVQVENDMMVSMNYMAPKGVAYDPLKGFNEDLYASVLQIFSTQEEVKQRFILGKKNMYEIDLNLSGDQAAAVLYYSLFKSAQVQYSVPYDTWSSNCTTFLFDLVDAGLGLSGQIKPFRFSPLIASDTGLAAGFKALAKRGLVSEPTRVRLMNAEFGYGIFPSDSNRHFNSWIGKNLQKQP